MEQIVIWGEVLFLVDMSMDFCALYLVVRLLGQPVRLSGLLTASALCAAAGVASVAVPSVYTGLLLALGCIPAVCFLLFPKPNRRPLLFLKAVLLFAFLEAAAGGLMTAVFYSLNRWFSGVGFTAADTTSRRQWFRLCAAIIFAICGIVNRILQNACAKRYADTGGYLTIRQSGREIRTSCLLDSGNLVREPISGRAVAVLPEHCAEALSIDKDTLADGAVPRSRLIPLHSINGKQLLWGILPDQISLTLGDTVADSRDIDCYIVFSDAISEAVVPMSIIQ